jgi:hypothetical protein
LGPACQPEEGPPAMQIKVQGLINGAAWVLETHGSGVLSEILAGCQPAVRERYMTGIAIEWHDGAEFEEFLRGADALGGHPGSVAQEIGAAGARQSMKGLIHRQAFYTARRDDVLARMASGWRQFNDEGENLEEIGSDGCSMQVTGVKLPGPLFCATHEHCTSRGDETCVWKLQWKPESAA